MGGKNTKSSLRNAIVLLNISADPISLSDDKFWAQIFGEEISLADEVIKNITVQEIRMLRDGSPKNFAALAYKMVERLTLATGTLCNTLSQQTAVLNSIRILIRMIPCCFEDKEWSRFFENNSMILANDLRKNPKLIYPEKGENDRDYTSYVPQNPSSTATTPIESDRATASSSKNSEEEVNLLISEQSATSGSIKSDQAKLSLDQIEIINRATDSDDKSMMQALILSICDLLFCPEFTVLPHGVGYLGNAVDTPPEDLKSLSTYDYVWEPGVGFESSVNSTVYYDKNRSELLCALLVCLSKTLYETPESSIRLRNRWIETLATQRNRHALPLFTSLLNVILGHKPSRPILKINQYLFENSRERLVGLSVQLLNAILDYQMDDIELPAGLNSGSDDGKKNLFIDYMSRIHRKEDLEFMMKGFVRLMNDGLGQGYIWASAKCLDLDLELQLLFWRICSLNSKFKQHILVSNTVQDLVVPLLYHLNENFRETSKTALIHICIFNLLNLSSERNFGVRLNKPYTSNTLSNLPDFSGSHADLMIIVFHKLIMYGYKMNQLYDYLLTILVNVSPYLKGTTILASKCLIQLFETFSSPLVIFTEPCYHQLVIFLLEIFNNIIQYQFDGNSNLIYVIISKKDIFRALSSLPTSQGSINKVLKKLIKQKERTNGYDAGPKKHDSLKDIRSESDQRSTKTECHDFSSDEINQDLATVSCFNTAPDPESKSRKQEVSLVATPDLYHVTLPVYPFSSEERQRGSEDDNKNLYEGKTIFNFDDIMTDSNFCDLKDYEPELSTIDAGLIRKIDNVTTIRQELCTKTSDKTDSSSDVLVVSGMTVNKNGKSDDWRPTSSWLEQWKQCLPLQTILRMISALDPQIESLKQPGGRAVDESEIIKFLQNGTLVGLLPVPHPIQIRKYRTNSSSKMWFRACSWGIIYVRSTIWTGTNVRLIKMK